MIALPTAIGLLSSGSDAQAYNFLSGNLALARAIAVENGTYAGVHVQMADPNEADGGDPNLADTCYIAIVWINPSAMGDAQPKFTLADRTTPRKIPGGIAFGGWNIVHEPNYIWTSEPPEIDEGYFVVDPDEEDTTVSVADFTTFTIIFSPTGSIVSKVNGQNIVFDPLDIDPDMLFTGDGGELPRLWDPRLTADLVDDDDPDTATPETGEPGATIVTLFEYAKFMTAAAEDRNAFLDENAQYLPINLHTGQPFRRQ